MESVRNISIRVRVMSEIARNNVGNLCREKRCLLLAPIDIKRLPSEQCDEAIGVIPLYIWNFAFWWCRDPHQFLKMCDAQNAHYAVCQYAVFESIVQCSSVLRLVECIWEGIRNISCSLIDHETVLRDRRVRSDMILDEALPGMYICIESSIWAAYHANMVYAMLYRIEAVA